MSKDLAWRFSQVFGATSPAPVDEADIISTIEFDQTGSFLAVGDRGGRVVVFTRSTPTKTGKLPEYKFLVEFQSHEPSFDYLKSLEIDEKINAIKWLPRRSASRFLLSSNDKTVKLWKIFTKTAHRFTDLNITSDYRGRKEVVRRQKRIKKLKVPKMEIEDVAVMASPCKNYENGHMFQINSVSPNSDQQTFLSADDLRINLWNLDVTSECFQIVDKKPEDMDELSEVITSAEFHPRHCNIFLYSTSKGCVKMADMRANALCDRHSKQFEHTVDSKNSSFFADFLSSISDAKFSRDGKFIIARDYVQLKVWDVRKEKEPFKTFDLHNHLRSRFCELYESDTIFDSFKCCASPDSKYTLTGTYNNKFVIHNIARGTAVNLEAAKFQPHKAAVDLSRKGTINSLNIPLSPAHHRMSNGNAKAAAAHSENLDFTKKILCTAWHPKENVIAIGTASSLFTYNAVDADK